MFGLVEVWIHPHQACLFSLDEVARKLTLLICIGNNWVYAFVQLNEGALHVPLSNEGHISTMIDGALSRSTSGHLQQLGVHKLLQCGDHIVCPKGLNGDLEPVVLSLPETTPLQYEHPQQTYLQTFAATDGPLQCKARRPGAHCPKSLQNLSTFLLTFGH